ncbi:MAG: dihydrodipicolinate synthase family protein [Chloroflexota bacterium]
MDTTDILTIRNRIVTKRPIEGISAILMPFTNDGEVDFTGFAQHLERTVIAGLQPAVNMDTGYVNMLFPAERQQVLAVTQQIAGERGFVAGAFIEGLDGDVLTLYRHVVEEIQQHGGTPILFQCSALKRMSSAELIDLYRLVAADCDRLLAFELGEMFAPFGQIYPIEVFRELMCIPQLVGIKHSSLDRELEWQRLALRDQLRPDFKMYTGNDLAIDMVMYGSDYLLGLSTFAPEAFALRDSLWEKGDSAFYHLNDLLQYLGFFAFRSPVPAYKHSAAQFLKLGGWISSDTPHPASPQRPLSDLVVLQDIAERLEQFLAYHK